MPIQEIERLEKDSSDASVDAAVSACIATEIRNGRSKDQAIAMCMSMSREKSGRPAQKEGG